MDTATVTQLHLETVENRAEPNPQSDRVGNPEEFGEASRMDPQGTMAFLSHSGDHLRSSSVLLYRSRITFVSLSFKVV